MPFGTLANLLDVAKAHRRILIRAVDRRRQKLYQCWALNFGARFYWARAAGLLVRIVSVICWRSWNLSPHHFGPLFSSAPTADSEGTWHKGALASRVVWIGWELNLSQFCVRLDPAKFARLCSLLRQALSSKRCSTHLLERITGKLLWFSSALCGPACLSSVGLSALCSPFAGRQALRLAGV